MINRSRVPSMLLLFVLAASIGTATGGHCAKTARIVVFGHVNGVTSVSPATAACTVTDDHQVDPRIIPPGSDSISVRYREDAGAQSLVAVLNGLGFSAQQVILTRRITMFGVVYDSPIIPLRDGAGSSGCVVASIPVLAASNAFHTADSWCPEFAEH